MRIRPCPIVRNGLEDGSKSAQGECATVKGTKNLLHGDPPAKILPKVLRKDKYTSITHR